MNVLMLVSLIVGFVALLLSAYALWQIQSLNKLRAVFFAGNTTQNLEDVLESLTQHMGIIEHHQRFLDESIAQIQSDTKFAIQKIGIIRFNPFADGGGNFSFTVALLNAHNDGVIITSMHGREQNRIYAKKIHGNVSETALTEEEQQAISLANTNGSIQ